MAPGVKEFRETLRALRSAARAKKPRTARARSAADLIRQAGGYRWVGLYDVGSKYIAVIAWSGPAAPRHPLFPRTKGLNGAAVASRAPVVAQDVSKDPRYLATLGDTRGEMVVPVCSGRTTVLGTIDVESVEANAFADRDRALLGACAVALGPLWRTPKPRVRRTRAAKKPRKGVR